MDQFREMELNFLRRSAHTQLLGLQQSVEFLINATPSGKSRNTLTEANIHLMIAEENLKKVIAFD